MEKNVSLKESKTEQNLKDAFAGESQANRRYLYFAAKADVEGYNDVAAVFRSTAEGETGHAHGHLEYLEEVGDPATGLPIGGTELNLKASVAGETHEYTDMYPGMAATAKEEGFDEIAAKISELTNAAPPSGIAELIRMAKQFSPLLKLKPKRIKRGAPCQEVVQLTANDEVDVTRLPIIKCWPYDGDPRKVGYDLSPEDSGTAKGDGRFITFAAGQVLRV